MGASYSTAICQICASSRYTSDFKKVTRNCNHPASICQHCVNKHIETELRTKGNLEVKCIYAMCKRTMEYNDIQMIAKKPIMERYDKLLLYQALRRDPNFRWCKNSKCGSGQIHSGGDDAPIMRCMACSTKSCYTHDVPWHEDLTCSEYDTIIDKADEATQDLLNRETKACPKCGIRITKIDGCNHMTCKYSSCKYEFCWLCLADFNDIRKNGNTSHKRTCQLYA